MEDDGLGLSLGIKSYEKRHRRTPPPLSLLPLPLVPSKHGKNSIFYKVDHFHKSPPQAPYKTTLNLGWIGAKPKPKPRHWHNHKGVDREISINDGEADGGHADQRGDVGVVVAAGGGEGGPEKKKLRLSKEQSSLLEQTFLEHSTLNNKQKLYLAKELKLMPRQVEVWFQNRRARTKLKQTEVNCEFLKEYCKRLSEENKRLHKELKQLTPPSGLILCHACNRGSATPTPSSAVDGGKPCHTFATPICPVDQLNVSSFFFKKASLLKL